MGTSQAYENTPEDSAQTNTEAPTEVRQWIVLPLILTGCAGMALQQVRKGVAMLQQSQEAEVAPVAVSAT